MTHRLSTTLLGLLPSVVILGVAGLMSWSWRGDLPDPIAIHFSADGADGYGSLAGFLGLMLGVFGAVAVGAWLVALLLGRSSMTRRIGVGVAVGMSCFGAAILLGTLHAMRGLSDASEVDSVDAVLGLGLLDGLVLGGLAAWAIPGDRADPATGAVSGPRMALGEEERAVWTRRVTSPVGMWVGGGAVLLMTALALVTRMPYLIAVAVVLAALLGATTVFQVTVSTAGLRVQSIVGWPRMAIPADEITSVRVAEVKAFREFGGWGARVGRGGEVGYVLRDGEGIRVGRTGDRSFVVTVPDAETGAALLTTMAERARSGRPSA